MNSKTQTSSQNGVNIGKALLNTGEAILNISKICYHGLKRLNFSSIEFWLSFVSLALVVIHVSFVSFYHLRFLHFIWEPLFSLDLIVKLSKISGLWHFSFLFGGTCLSILFFLGIKEYRRIKRIQTAINDLGFSTKSGQESKVKSITDQGNGRLKVLAYSGSAGLSKFEAKKEDLTAGLGMLVEHIRVPENNRTMVEIFLSERPLTSKFKFSTAKSLLTKPYHFVAGQSYDGPIIQNIRTLPHMFIAGTTGGGKSTFFNNVLLGLMHSSERIRFYLIDLKRGLEVQDYERFPSVEIAKTPSEALKMLKSLNKLMDSRIDFLRDNQRRDIDPNRDEKDIIVVAFDEVSEVFDTQVRDKDRKKENQEIYEQAHRLAKLSRAAGFHLIFSTQKIKKNLLPTEIQTNIGGRAAFRMPTPSDSVTAIGNKQAFDLPETKGRAIWNTGNKFTVVQAPFLSDEEIKEEIKGLKGKFERLSKVNKGKEENQIKEIVATSDVDIGDITEDAA